jgi:hypothetical protein
MPARSFASGGARAQLVKTKVDLGNQIRGLLRTFGLLVGQAGGKKFDQRVQELLMDEDDLRPPIEALLVCWRRICEQIDVLDKHLHAAARRSPSVRWCPALIPSSPQPIPRQSMIRTALKIEQCWRLYLPHPEASPDRRAR